MFNLIVLIVTLLSIVSYSCMEVAPKCNPNINTAGITLPSGDIYREEGSSVEIYCVIINMKHPTAINKNSSNLVFYNGTELISSSNIIIVNETTIKVHLDNVEKGEYNFKCMLKGEKTPQEDKLICFNKVYIDTKPQPINNLKCLSHNWENLSCKWNNPFSVVKTKYLIKYRIKNLSFPCPLSTREEDSCLWDLTTDPIYKRSDKELNFTIVGTNKFGTWSSNDIVFMHFENVVPDPPSELRVVNKTTNSVGLSWKPAGPMNHFPGVIVHKVEYQSTWDKDWTIADISKLLHKSGAYYLSIDNLYANTHYEVRIYMKLAVAKNDSELWSHPSIQIFNTLSMIPKNPPKTDIGSFQIENGPDGRRCVYLYWQKLQEFAYNGINFTYIITLVNPQNGEEIVQDPDEKTNTYAKFNDLFEDSEYTFRIYSANANGTSKNYSEIIVPMKDNILSEINSFTKVAYGSLIYELSWVKPLDFDVNYTLFWCANDRDRPYQCNGYLNWTHIPGDITAHNITVPNDNIYQFAISKNRDMTSSGMVWAQCTVLRNQVSRMNNVYIKAVGPTSILMAWHLECSDRFGVRGFIIFYCPTILQDNKLECRGHEMNVTINDSSVTSYNVTNLHPYRSYKLRVAIKTRNGQSEPSEPMFNTTYEAAPKAPIILNVSKTNTSAIIQWERPNEEESNGVIISYEFCFNKIYCNEEKENNKLLLKKVSIFNDLEPYHEYRLTIRALTKAWSEYSKGYVFTTGIGYPSKINLPTIENITDTALIVSWNQPEVPAGPIDGYEIKIDNMYNLPPKYSKHYCENETCSAYINFSSSVRCVGYNDRPTIQIRAFNQIKLDNNTLLYSEWSDSVSLSCSTQILTFKLLFIFMFISSFSVLLVYYLGKKLHAWYKNIKETIKGGPMLPPGLCPEKETNTFDKTELLTKPLDYNNINEQIEKNYNQIEKLLENNLRESNKIPTYLTISTNGTLIVPSNKNDSKLEQKLIEQKLIEQPQQPKPTYVTIGPDGTYEPSERHVVTSQMYLTNLIDDSVNL